MLRRVATSEVEATTLVDGSYPYVGCRHRAIYQIPSADAVGIGHPKFRR
jgi:hypothetical protein